MPPIGDYLTFVRIPLFNSSWEKLGLDDADAARLEQEIIRYPLVGAVISGTGGLRKMRFAPPGSGKSGGVRVCYVLFPEHELVLLVVAYGKTRKADLSSAEKKLIARLLKEFEEAISGAEPE
jgi:hypothetical protein